MPRYSSIRRDQEGSARRVWQEGYDEGFRAGYDRGLLAGFETKDPSRRAPSKRGNPHPKKRRKTAYQSAYSAAYKRLKKKHPRMSFGSLSKKAHTAARKKVK